MSMNEAIMNFVETILENEDMAEELRRNSVVKEKLTSKTSILDAFEPDEIEKAFWHLVQRGSIDCDIEKWVDYDEIENAYANCLVSGYISLDTELIQRVVDCAGDEYGPEDFFLPEQMEKRGWTKKDKPKTPRLVGVEITTLPEVNSDDDVDKYIANEIGDALTETEAEVFNLVKEHETTITIGCVIGRPVYE